MTDYEVVYIFDSALTDEAVGERLDRFHALLTKAWCEGTAPDPWGRRSLAYPIRKKTSGTYVVAQFRTQATALPEFERLLKLDEELLRYLVVLHEGEPTAPMSVATREPRREGEDEEEDE